MCFTLHESHHFNDTCLIVSLVLMHQSTPNFADSGEVSCLNLSKEVKCHQWYCHQSDSSPKPSNITCHSILTQMPFSSRHIYAMCLVLLEWEVGIVLKQGECPPVNASPWKSTFSLISLDKAQVESRFPQKCQF